MCTCQIVTIGCWLVIYQTSFIFRRLTIIFNIGQENKNRLKLCKYGQNLGILKSDGAKHTVYLKSCQTSSQPIIRHDIRYIDRDKRANVK